MMRVELIEPEDGQKDKMPAYTVHAAKIRPIHHESHRYGEWATVLAVRIVTPDGALPRPVLEVVFDDGQLDYIPLANLRHYDLQPINEN